MANTKDLAKLLDKGTIQAAFQEALQETADSMVDEITQQAVAMIRDEAVVFLEARKEELIKQLQIETTESYHVKIRNRIYIFLLVASTGFLTQLEQRFSEKIRAQKD